MLAAFVGSDVMAIENAVVLAGIVLAFTLFAGVLARGDAQTRRPAGK
jgi:hypothetical protein